MSQTSFKNSLQMSTVQILAGQTLSIGFDSTNLQNANENVGGTFALRRITTPANWTTSDVRIIVQNDDAFTTPTSLVIGDGTDRAIVLIPQLAANESFVIPPYWTDSLIYFQILSVTAQANTVDLQLYMQPIYQVMG